jgi:glycosyltransferase involved in cell wall biosynthesis
MERKYRIAANFCDWVVGICDATTNNIKAAGSAPERKIERVYNGTFPIQRVALEQRPPKTGFTLLYVGRLEPVKNHDLLLNAFRSALSHRPDLHLWIVGDGSERKRTEELAAILNLTANVKFWGQQLDVAAYFSAGDVFIMSSKSEGLPMSLLQAFSLGVPAIVTDVGGMAEVVRMAQAGIVVPVDGIDPMARAILRLAGDASERERFSRSAQAAFAQHFTLEAMIDHYMELYRNTPRARRKSLT